MRAGSYGHTLGGSVGLAMVEGVERDAVECAKYAKVSGVGAVNKKYLDEGEWQAGIAGKKYPARVSLKPLYDPGNERIKG